MTDKQFTEKYDAEIRTIARANNVDMGVGLAMLVYELKCRIGMIEKEDNYAGIDELDLTEAVADYQAMVNARA